MISISKDLAWSCVMYLSAISIICLMLSGAVLEARTSSKEKDEPGLITLLIGVGVLGLMLVGFLIGGIAK